MKQEPIIITTSPDPKDDQLRVILYPEDSHYSFDCVRIKLKDIGGTLKQVDMTPDEALELASLLNNAVQFFLLTNPEYDKFIKREKKKHGKETGFK